MDIISYYRKLISLPSSSILAFLLVIEVVVYGLVKYLMGLHPSHILRGMGIVLTSVMVPFLLPFICKDKDVYTLKRVMFIGVISLPLVTLSDIIGKGKASILSLMPAIYLQLIATQMIQGPSKSRSLLIGLINVSPMTILSYLTGDTVSIKWWFRVFITLLVPSIALAISVIMLQRISKEIGIDIVKLGSGFAKMWLAGKREELERELKILAEPKDVEVHLIIFTTFENKRIGILVIPEVHYGPFRNVGSSELPALIIRELEKVLGCKCIVLHGAVTHKRNLASVEDLFNLVKGVKANISSTISNSSKGIIDPVRVDGHKFRVLGICLGKTALLFASTRYGGIEDIPYSYWQYAKNLALSLGFRDVILVDEHNSILEGETIDYEELRMLINECLKQLSSKAKEEILVGIASSDTPLDERKGVGRGGIRVLYLRGLKSGKQLVLVVIDGNNMVRKFRESIEMRIHEEFGIDYVEILTTDTHAVSGIIREGRGYVAIGELKEHEVLIDIICKCIGNAINICKRGLIEENIIKVPGIRVYGELLSKIYTIIPVGYKTFMFRSIPLSFLLIFIVLLMFSVIM